MTDVATAKRRAAEARAAAERAVLEAGEAAGRAVAAAEGGFPPAPTEGVTLVPFALMTDGSLSDAAVRLWCALSAYDEDGSGASTPALPVVAHHLGWSERKAERALRELHRRGLADGLRPVPPSAA